MAAAEQGLTVRPTWPVIANRGSPGLMDPYNPAAALLFDTAFGVTPADALVVFFAEELPTLDWLADYVMDEEVRGFGQDDGPSFDLKEEEEIHYEKRALTTTESDTGWDT